MSSIADLNSEARDLCDADTTSYPAAALLRRINYAYEIVVGWIIGADGTWQFDDTNYTNFPIGTYTLTAGTGRYSFNDKFLQLEEVQILRAGTGGNYEIIPPLDQKELGDQITPLDEIYSENGFPQFYDKVSDDTIELFPSPASADVNLTNGLKIRFKRTADLYTSAQVTTGTKEPGFASSFHSILSYMAARPYCLTYKPERVTMIDKVIGDTTLEPTGMKVAILNHYSRRSKDQRKRMTMAFTPFR